MTKKTFLSVYVRSANIPGAGRRDDWILYGGLQYLWALRMELAWCHGVQISVLAFRFLENLWTPGLSPNYEQILNQNLFDTEAGHVLALE